MRPDVFLQFGSLIILLLLSFNLFRIGHGTVIVYKNLCSEQPELSQCQAILNFEKLPTNYWCFPKSRVGCKLNDLVSDDIASCTLNVTEEEKGFYHRCFPHVAQSHMKLNKVRIVAKSVGDPSCVPLVYKKRKFHQRFVCGEQGTRCVCDNKEIIKKNEDKDLIESSHNCRCQWFVDYCAVKNACSSSTQRCQSNPQLKCIGGSLNQCLVEPTLCQSKNSYCVELDDHDLPWSKGTSVIGQGFSCIDKITFHQLTKQALYCNFNISNHVLVTGKDFVKPSTYLDYCCYSHLVCIRKKDLLGGYLFKDRPCYCNMLFRKCLLGLKNDFSLWKSAKALVSIIESVDICSIDDSGKCNPLKPQTCNKGDLIAPAIAHCRVNCKSGPLLPIELRSCKIRKCYPPNNLATNRIIDVPFYRDSPRCDPVSGLLVRCGMEHTRCVCDGKPTFKQFTDGCRCQYWTE